MCQLCILYCEAWFCSIFQNKNYNQIQKGIIFSGKLYEADSDNFAC
jgi:hypothetical protein